MSSLRYQEYKSSGEEWQDTLPSHWDVLALSRVLSIPITDGPHSTPVFESEGIPFLSVDGIQAGELVFDGCRHISLDDHIEFSKKAKPIRNDILMGKAASIGKIARVKVDIDFNIWSPLALIRLDSNICIPEFMEYVLKSRWLQVQIENKANSNTQLNIGMKDICKLRFFLPPYQEQCAIAKVLDLEISKIDNFIFAQEKLIALLSEKRQATISHAVTKGLNPNVQMNDSGVEWLGEVPKHWTRTRVKFLVSSKDGIQMGPFGGMLLDLDSDSTGYKVYGQENTISGDFTLGNRWISETRFLDLKKYSIESGDLVLTRKGSLGNARLISELPYPGIADSDTIRVRVNGNYIKNDFLSLLFHEAAYVFEQISFSKRGAILSGINSETIANIIVMLPPIAEQDELLIFIQKKIGVFDTGISDCRQAINLLKERRSAFISAAVTGKIDVRQAVQQEQASLQEAA